ncbi:hypothetical protein HDV04_005428 [Boothiomyces sp. JEL0838]|nr:hypothetical protein HDV04_005428 [Boothiomyces sp. JEL0838]
MFKPSNEILFKDPLHLVSFKFFKSLEEPEPAQSDILPKGWDGFMPNIDRISLTSKVGKWGGFSVNRASQASLKKSEMVPIRMLRSPLADNALPPVQRFLFVQNKASAISGVVG